MRKSILSASIAAMIGGLGFAGAASAAVFSNGPTAGTIQYQNSGIGDILLVPYFTSQGSNATLLNITNTDTVNGKAVKVRFRGASNSDDIFDFQLYLSPGDVWAAKVSRDTATGLSKLETADNSCTLPGGVGKTTTAFVTGRLNSKLTGDALAAETREGYVEILTMADIKQAGFPDQATGTPLATPTVNPLFTATKHVAGVAPCFSTAAGSAALNLLINDPRVYARSTTTANSATAAAGYSANALGLAYPTGKLMANYTIIDVVNTATFSGEAVALKATAGANLVFFPQAAAGFTDTYIGSTDTIAAQTTIVGDVTADPLFRTDSFLANGTTLVTTGTTALVTPGYYDLPDLSTPYAKSPASTANGTDSVAQAKALTASLAVNSVVNEYLTTTSIAATTDWVFSMPTRRYAVAYNYAAATGADGRIFSAGWATPGAYFTPSNTTLATNGYQICVATGAVAPFDREETAPAAASVGFVVSPSSVAAAATVRFCGEASVISINAPVAAAPASPTLKSTVTRQDISVTTGNEGWLTINTPNGALGLPVLGKAYVKSSGFGANWSHRY
ncbi:cell surface protein [Curvibacter sp. HBC28]|uniref:Cell surface protein n=1 Tax=Curvibacter microcysteis TaxID=3026419 RepID=A0ABT5MA45_9BURK|nr:cell surface protein [Curvibacter sp. HBC28]MDD0813459.1 cell surface protein [Curvibacter sp. HBC28]